MFNAPASRKVFLVAQMFTVSTLMTSSASLAASRIFDLHLKNGSRKDTITFTLRGSGTGQNFCYEGTPGINQQVGGPVKPGEFVTVRLARIQGHGCDGEQGIFSVEPSNSNGMRAHFNFNNSGGLAVTNFPNSLVGKLSAKSPQDESYTWETLPEAIVTASKPVGRWNLVCQQLCDMTFKTEIVNSKTDTTTTTEETRSALAVSLEAGFEFGGASGKVGVTASEEQAYGRSMSHELSSSSMTGSEAKVNLTIEQMEERGLFAVWQWVVSSTLSTGESVVLKTTKYTCSSDAVMPTYLPGSAQDIAACRKRKEAPEPPKSVADSGAWQTGTISGGLRGIPSGVQAVVGNGKGKVYFFQGAQYWRWDAASQQVDSGYPQMIAAGWSGLPNDIDAAVNGHNGKFYFFKGAQYWRWDIEADTLDEGYPNAIASGWAGLPNNLDGAVRGRGSELFFFSGNSVWQWDMTTDTLTGSGTIGVDFSGLPASIDAASTMDAGDARQTYFKGDSSYRATASPGRLR